MAQHLPNMFKNLYFISSTSTRVHTHTQAKQKERGERKNDKTVEINFVKETVMLKLIPKQNEQLRYVATGLVPAR